MGKTGDGFSTESIQTVSCQGAEDMINSARVLLYISVFRHWALAPLKSGLKRR